MEYVQLFAAEGFSRQGSFGIKILVAGSNLPDLSAEAIAFAAYEAADKVTTEVRAAAIAQDPAALRRAADDKAALLGLFPCRIFVDEIPNGYGQSWHNRHLPWFIVTTAIGRFKIGWRKRVIHIEWTETVGTKPAEALFADEDVTKADRVIHAWSLEKAKQYIDTILAGVQP